MKSTLTALFLTASLGILGCEKQEPAPAATSGSNTTTPTANRAVAPGAETPAAALPADLFLTAAPEGAKDVKAAKDGVKAGDKVILVGRIGGRMEPFVTQRAIFQVVDPGMPSCADNEGDTCKTPWDYCCESATDIAASSATIQVVDAAGAPLKLDLMNQHGLKPLARVTVVGTVASAEAGNLVVNATGIHVGG